MVDFVLEYQVEPRSRKHELFEELDGDESVNEAYYGLVSHKEPSNFGEDFPGRIFQKLLSGELAALSQIIEKLELLLDDLELLLLVIKHLDVAGAEYNLEQSLDHVNRNWLPAQLPNLPI